MNKIAIVIDSEYKHNRRSLLDKLIKENLNSIFGQKIKITNYYIDKLVKGDLIKDDLVLVMAGSRVLKIKNFVNDTNNIVVIKRTFLKKGINQLFQIPNDSDVLVVNDDIETVLNSISSLYQIGIKHVNLIPYEKDKDYHKIKYAITPSENELVPNYIKNIYDVGNRMVDVSTILLIMSKLNINDKVTQQNLYNYYQNLFSSNNAITENFNNLLFRTEEIDNLLDLSHDGILLTDKDGKILICNAKFKEIFNINENIVSTYLHQIIENIDFSKYYSNSFHDGLIYFKNKYINLEKKNITYFNSEFRMYFSFQEVTYIKKLEQNLSHKLRQKGQIAKYTFKDIITQSDKMNEIIKNSKKIAKTDLTVLITGESGTGKEVLAQAIHNYSNRKKQPFIAINVASIPDSLLESELFGYTKGSFTGALNEGKKGIFERANSGTLFLDEIGDMPKHLQSKLLRVLQEKQVIPIGSENVIEIDVRIIAATHKNPIIMIKEGNFRKDLFYRLNVFPLELPPLKDRNEDVKLLLNHFTNNKFEFSKECLKHLLNYNWPGNIRELCNIAMYISTLEEKQVVETTSLPNYLTALNFDENIKAENIFAKEITIIKELSNYNLSKEILKSIKILNEIDKTAGRKHLLNYLENRKIKVSENTLKKSLKALSKSKLIFSKKGRSGNYINEKGNSFLEYTKELL
ncbi:sigma 54-interacting transcriptional regulator [Helicovermis profundi]|uniref:Sigma 54-interacting transcriptional regulator n=1 Tax=Helicovermis profundi TaxID=3065157 RepID=A0AAU9ENU9_9FIRM|nr:sigma 54-interacting transcriptional regulator [Clostridia bacterium S502]